MKIQQGDQYLIPIKITAGDVRITPDNCTDVRIQVNKRLLSYDGGEGEITYRSTDQTWCFPLDEEMSFDFNSYVLIQIGVKFEDDFIYSAPRQVDVGRSIIREEWADEES